MALPAQLAVPNNEPVKLVALTLPVTTTDPNWLKEPVNEIVSILALNTEPVPVMLTDPVTPNDPLIWAEPVYGKGAMYPVKWEAVTAFWAIEALTATDDEAAYEALLAFAAFVANDALIAVKENAE